jgi:RNA polymerase sigma-54 factor
MLKQSLFQKQLQKLSPQQIKLMKLIQLPTTELEQRIKEEIQEKMSKKWNKKLNSNLQYLKHSLLLLKIN